jgi:hypothetical protein
MLYRFLQSFRCDIQKQKAYDLIMINEKKDLFIGEFKKNQFVNFPPIMKNIGNTNSKEMIGEALYNYMNENGMKVEGQSVKLSQLLDTHLSKTSRNNKDATAIIAISSYYLWFLIDTGLIVDDVKSMMIFSKHLDLKDLLKNL